ncbi:hypothetical protein ACTFIZ_004600 [Dictyostelium cf. discoideum]
MKFNIDKIEKQILLDLWDCASQSEYNLLRPKNYQNVNVFLICFSIISNSSFNNILNKWNPECRHYSPNIPIILVATKLDKRDDKEIKDKLNPISYEQGHNTLMKKIKAIQYLECSALTKQGLKIVFDEAVKVSIGNDPFLKKNKNNNQTSN